MPKLLDSKRRSFIVAAAVVASLLSVGLVQMPSAAAPLTPADDKPVAVGLEGIDKEHLKDVVGKKAATEDDVAYTVLSDADGVTVLKASSLNGYRWDSIASLPVDTAETDLWMANSCVTSSGDYMAVVYAPRSISNNETLFGGGALAAIVDLKTGEVRELGYGYSMAYFNPGCGAKDKVAIVRYPDESATSLLAVVDAKTGHVDRKYSAHEQVTSPTVDQDGLIVAATAKGIVRFRGGDEPELVAKTTGFAYGLTVDGHGRLGYLEHQENTAEAGLLDLTKKSPKAKNIAKGPLTNLGLARSADGTLFVLGEGVTLDIAGVPSVKAAPQANWHATVSSTGEMVVNETKPVGYANPQDITPEGVSSSISAVSAATGKELKFALRDSVHGAVKLVPEAKAKKTSAGDSGSLSALSLETTTLLASGAVPASANSLTGSPSNPSEDSAERVCAVPRNDKSSQALQPKPRQVEWAVDLAVAGHLNVLNRPAGWNQTGMAAYSPGVDFPPTPLLGGGTIPPQIVLGVLAQESNLWQASKYTSPGETGNPLIGDFYGSRPHVNEAAASIWDIHFTEADCGYGVGQITDGMRLAGQERTNEVALPVKLQREIALDYAANVAKTVQMLGQKWNEVRSSTMMINNGASNQIENWFFAVWAYNTGFHQNTGGNWGVGWVNNPINPIYAPSRTPFLEYSSSDASHPQEWPYPEKVMGFAAWSLTLSENQVANPSTRSNPTTYVAGFRLAWWNLAEYRTSVKPPTTAFCSLAANNCNPATGSCNLDHSNAGGTKMPAGRAAHRDVGTGLTGSPRGVRTQLSSRTA
jgi:hypothetical protein